MLDNLNHHWPLSCHVLKFNAIFKECVFLRDFRNNSPSFSLKFEWRSRVIGPWIDMSVFRWFQLDLLNMDFISSTDKIIHVFIWIKSKLLLFMLIQCGKNQCFVQFPNRFYCYVLTWNFYMKYNYIWYILMRTVL